ncbi:MAG: hypothetical protein M0D57_18175 [Sphingobacteriales bacterium JAD_PAG50586_3]|nr:MAG: hypothetical protein M0D57_18175 [Sphingobacteriales bacterium JAD_PAG50586_3]
MKVVKGLVLAFIAAALFQSCGNEPPPEPEGGTLTVNFNPTANGQPFVLGNGFTSAKGLPYEFSLFKFYISNLRLYGTSEPDTILDADLINFSNDQAIRHTSFSVKVQPGTYSGFSFGVGLDSIQNRLDPTTFPSTSPYSASAGTHWGMFFMYRFVMIEGAIDTSENGLTDYELPIIMHTGFDSLYITKEFAAHPFEVKEGENTTININFDFNRLFYGGNDTLDLLTNHITHTSDNYPLAAKITRNFKNALQVGN